MNEQSGLPIGACAGTTQHTSTYGIRHRCLLHRDGHGVAGDPRTGLSSSCGPFETAAPVNSRERRGVVSRGVS